MKRRSKYTFEQIQDHMADLDLETVKVASKEAVRQAHEQYKAAPNPADVIGKLCTVYYGVRPILVSLSVFFFIPKKWRDVVKAFTDTLDQLCPGA